MPDELIVILTSMTPIGELRAAIPLALVHYDMSWPQALILGILGNLIPIPFILVGLRVVGERFERRDDLIGRLLRWRTAKIQRTWGERVERYGFWAILLIVAIPLPLTGAWTGALTVWAMRFNVKMGLAAIALGVSVAGVIVTALTQAGIGVISMTG